MIICILKLLQVSVDFCCRSIFIKIDIEGWEASAMQCAGNLFQSVNVKGVLMEWTWHRSKRSGGEIMDFMIKHGLLPYEEFNSDRTLLDVARHLWPDDVYWIQR